MIKMGTHGSKKEVCLDNVLYSGQTKKGENVIVHSAKGKVSYKASRENMHIFDTKRYTNIFKLLDSLEDNLASPLNFLVSVDFMTMEAIMEFLEYNDINLLKKTVDTRLFELINDLSVQRKSLSSKHIVDEYLNVYNLNQLKEFYDTYNEKVVEYFNKNYSSLPLYKALYNKERENSLTSNITRCIKDNTSSTLKKNLACDLLVELGNKSYYYMSDKTIEELSYKAYYINKFFENIKDEDISLITYLDIDNIYLLLNN